MLARISGRALVCLNRAAYVRRKATEPDLPAELRNDYRHLEQHWMALAESLQFAERISKFIEWRSRRLAVNSD